MAARRPSPAALLLPLAILAFAGNSLLTRASLAQLLIGAGAFAALRLGAGAALLGALTLARGGSIRPTRAELPGIIALAVYMGGFTFAYLELGAGTGALILFAVVQLTMLTASLLKGQRPTAREGCGALLALGGLIWLLASDLGQSALLPALSMTLAAVGWGVYTLIGRGAKDPLAQTSRNFIGAAPVGLALWALSPSAPMTTTGALLAITAGAITSGLGYAIWYAALPRLSRISAGVAQLLVPPVTAIIAALWLGEALTFKLISATALILAGVALSIKPTPAPSSAK